MMKKEHKKMSSNIFDLKYRRHNLPYLKNTRAELRDKQVKSQFFSKQSLNTLNSQKKMKINFEQVRLLKYVSLIKSDSKSLSKIPTNISYCPYSRKISSVIKTNCNQLPCKREENPQSSFQRRSKTQEKTGLIVCKFNLLNKYSAHSNKNKQSQMDFNSRILKPSKLRNKRASTEEIYNFVAVTERKKEFTKEGQQIPTFLTEDIGLDSIDRDKEFLRKQIKIKLSSKQKFMLKKQQQQKCKPNICNNFLFNSSVRGWTKYNASGPILYQQQPQFFNQVPD